MFFVKNKSFVKHKGTQNIDTGRFLLRKFKLDDANDIFTNWTSDKESCKYNAWNVHSSINVTSSYLENWIKYSDKLNYYHWAITDKNTYEVIGSISVSNIKDKVGYCEIGYTVARKYWNQGIATEVLINVINYLTNDVGFTNIRAFYDIRNKASGRVMEKANMKYIKNQKKFFLNSNTLVMNCAVYEYKIKKMRNIGIND